MGIETGCMKSTLRSFALPYVSRSISWIAQWWLNLCVHRNNHQNLLKYRLWALTPDFRIPWLRHAFEWLWYWQFTDYMWYSDYKNGYNSPPLPLSITIASDFAVPLRGGDYLPIPWIQASLVTCFSNCIQNTVELTLCQHKTCWFLPSPVNLKLWPGEWAQASLLDEEWGVAYHQHQSGRHVEEATLEQPDPSRPLQIP